MHEPRVLEKVLEKEPIDDGGGSGDVVGALDEVKDDPAAKLRCSKSFVAETERHVEVEKRLKEVAVLVKLVAGHELVVEHFNIGAVGARLAERQLEQRKHLLVGEFQPGLLQVVQEDVVQSVEPKLKSFFGAQLLVRVQQQLYESLEVCRPQFLRQPRILPHNAEEESAQAPIVIVVRAV